MSENNSAGNGATSHEVAWWALNGPLGVALVALGTVAAASLGFYNIGLETGKAELKQRQDLASLNLPAITQSAAEATARLESAAAAFDEMLANNKTYEEMKAGYEALSSQLAESETQKAASDAALADSEARLKAASDRLAALTDPEQIYEVKTKSALTLFGDLLTVGVLRINVFGDASLSLNGEKRDVAAGTIVDVPGRQLCTLRIRHVDYAADTVHFTANCDLPR